jgi:hypothetical protein
VLTSQRSQSTRNPYTIKMWPKMGMRSDFSDDRFRSDLNILNLIHWLFNSIQFYPREG